MRDQIDALVEAEMPRLLELLGEIQTADDAQKGLRFGRAREQSRAILVELLAQRQAVLRRLRMAELAAQARQILQSQTRVLATTQGLSQQPPAEREPLVLAAVEDQRDVKAVWLRFQDTLKDVSSWGGPVGIEAASALGLVEKARLTVQFDDVTRRLEQQALADAATQQRSVIRSLEELLRIIERAQGLVAADRQSAVGEIRKLSERQRQLREEAKRADLDAKQSEQLVKDQGELADQLRQLGKEVPPSTGLQEAEAAATRATERLFEDKKPEAIGEQGKVLDHLEKAARQLEASQTPQDQPGDQGRLAQATTDLEAVRADLQRIRQQQEEASRAAQTAPANARKQEEAIAGRLGEVSNNRRLGTAVEARLGEAQAAARQAASVMKAEEPADRRNAAATRTEQAIERAAAEVESALADAKRQQAAPDPRRLAEVAGEQLRQVRAAQQAVEKAMAEGEESLGRRLERLQRAEDAVRKAEADQHRAAGRPEAARALDLVAEIKKAAALQREADRAADAAQEPSGSPIEAIDRQKRVAQAVRALTKQSANDEQPPSAAATPPTGEAPAPAKPADPPPDKPADKLEPAAQKMANADTKPAPAAAEPAKAEPAKKELSRAASEPADPVQQSLDRAEKSAENAAESLLDGKPEQAGQARTQTRDALAEALRHAQSTADQARRKPAAPVGPLPQRAVGEKIAEAQELAQPDAPEAAATLDQAAKSSAKAQSDLATGEPAAAKNQDDTAASLAAAGRQIEEARDRLAREAESRLAKQSADADALTEAMIPADPGATAAVQQAENFARDAARQAKPLPQTVPAAEQAIQAALARAMAELGARERQLAQALAAAAAPDAGQPEAGPPQSGQSPATQASSPPNGSPQTASTQGAGRLQGDSPSAGSSADVQAGRKAAQQPWIMELPAEVRAAIRANSQRRPPRGYEERLERYFKNID